MFFTSYLINCPAYFHAVLFIQFYLIFTSVQNLSGVSGRSTQFWINTLIQINAVRTFCNSVALEEAYMCVFLIDLYWEFLETVLNLTGKLFPWMCLMYAHVFWTQHWSSDILLDAGRIWFVSAPHSLPNSTQTTVLNHPTKPVESCFFFFSSVERLFRTSAMSAIPLN